MRTSSYDFDISDKSNLMVHLTNEAVQVQNKTSFGAHEPGNKVYFPEIEEYFSTHPTFASKGKSFLRDIVPLMKVIEL